MTDDILKELNAHNITVQNGTVIIGDNNMGVNQSIKYYKDKSQKTYEILIDIWNEVKDLLLNRSCRETVPSSGIDSIFIFAMQDLKRFLYLYPSLNNFNDILSCLQNALDADINTFSHECMSKIIEYKLAIEWLSHLVAKNLYIKSLLIAYKHAEPRKVIAKGVHGPYSNLDLPMQERVFSWTAIDEEVRGRSRDLRNQHRYRMGLERYNSPFVNEGFTWRELRNEPFLWSKQDENPYPHRNLLWH